MMKRVSWLSARLPEKNHLIRPVIILLVLVSLACTLPEMTALLPADVKPTVVGAAGPTEEPSLQGPFPAALIECWPTDGSVLDRHPEFTFYFNQSMNRVSVEKAFTFQPVLTG